MRSLRTVANHLGFNKPWHDLVTCTAS